MLKFGAFVFTTRKLFPDAGYNTHIIGQWLLGHMPAHLKLYDCSIREYKEYFWFQHNNLYICQCRYNPTSYPLSFDCHCKEGTYIGGFPVVPKTPKNENNHILITRNNQPSNREPTLLLKGENKAFWRLKYYNRQQLASLSYSNRTFIALLGN